MFVDKASVVRLVALIVALLTYFGINLPENVVEAITSIAVGVYALYMAWKNNDFTEEAKQGTKHMKELKERNK